MSSEVCRPTFRAVDADVDEKGGSYRVVWKKLGGLGGGVF